MINNNMHEAYTVHALSKLSVSIESITAYDNNVILGTRTGQLLMYSVNKNEFDNKMELQLLKFDKNFSKKAIVQIEVVPEESLLFSLSDGIINVSDMNRMNFSLIYSAIQTKGASIFCMDVKSSQSMTGEIITVIRICVAIKRKLQFWYWKHDKLLELKVSIELKDIPKALSWVDDVICVGFKDEYVLYDISDEPKKHDLVVTSSSHSQDPCICILRNHIFGLAKDEYVVAIDTKDLIKKDLKEKTSKQTPEKLSGLANPDGPKQLKPLTWSQSVLDLVWDDPYAIGRTSNCVEIRCLDTNGINKDTLVQTIPELGKARYIVRSSKGSLFAAAFSELWYIEGVDIQKQRLNLLQEKRFQLAIELTNISEEAADEKIEIIRQIQTRFAKQLFANKQFPESMHEFTKLQADAYDVIRLFPGLLPQDNQKSPSNVDLFTATMPILEDKELENALLALQDFLAVARQREIQKSKELNKSPKASGLLSIIDTTLLKCYLQTNDSLVAPLLRLNHCHLEESELTLKKHKKYSELIILYQTNGKHQRALELLQKQATMSGSSLQGHERTIKYLQHLGQEHKHLIFEFSDWVLKKHPEEGLKIFTDDFIEVENLPRAEVLDYLLKGHKSLVIPYLEHIIHIWKEPKPMFHNILIQQYREKVQNLMTEIKPFLDGNVDNETRQKMEILKESRQKLVELLKNSDRYAPEVVLQDFPTSDLFEERAIILGKLKKHEKVLAIYIQILGDIDKAKEYCEKLYTEDSNIFAILIQTILTPPTSPPYTGVKLHQNCLKPNIDTVLELLDKYAKKIDPALVLQYLPDDIPIIRLKKFLETALRTQMERRRRNQVLKGLLYAEDLQLQEQRMRLESKNFVITEYTVCPVCKKRFTNQSAFVRYPNGEIVHYSCQERK